MEEAEDERRKTMLSSGNASRSYDDVISPRAALDVVTLADVVGNQFIRVTGRCRHVTCDRPVTRCDDSLLSMLLRVEGNQDAPKRAHRRRRHGGTNGYTTSWGPHLSGLVP